MKRTFALLLCLCALLSSLSFSVFAHPGDTDASGGHTNHSTGEYHYHHGYPAHHHTNGRCPYNYDDKTGQSSGSSGDSTSSDVREWILAGIVGIPFILFLLWVFLIMPITDKIRDWHYRKNHPQSKQEASPTPPKTPQQLPTSPPGHISESENDRPTTSKKVPPLPRTTFTQAPHIPPPCQTPTPRPLVKIVPPSAPEKPSPAFASGIIAEHPVILDADPDYLTEAQVLAYALSIETPRGKKAVTEQFVIKGDLTTNETTKPFQTSANVMSLGSTQQYHTTLIRCSCPDHRARHLPCKHMIALAINVNAITVDIEALQKREERS